MKDMHPVLISLASNYDQEKNLCEARQRLAQILSFTRYTHEIWTDAVGNGKGKYLNQLCHAQTQHDAATLESELKAIECDMGRTLQEKKEGQVRIDLDLLQHDRQRYHLRDWSRPYVTLLLEQQDMMS